MAGKWFYNKAVMVFSLTGGKLYHGSWIEGELIEKVRLVCDVQPANRELIFKEYGYYIDCSIRIFCDLCGLQVGDIAEYDGQRYKIVKVIKWDDYLDVFAEDYTDGE